MEKLKSIIEEISKSNQLQLNSFRNVVDARLNIEKSIRQSQIEYSNNSKKLSVLASKGKRDKEGVLITKLDVYNLSIRHKEVMKKSMETLALLQELERMMLGILNARNIDFIDATEVETDEIVITKKM